MGKHEAENAPQDEVQDQDSFPPVSSADLTEPIGTKIGPYKVLSFLGEGGFGIVYLAEQKKPVRRQVALKVIKPGMDSKQVIARFEAEQQALALLDHPNIAHVFDAGTTEQGRLYFAMEYVKGKSVTEYCDHEKLGIEERLRLFIRICEAVQHAHQKGIIHRDIKPSNILVSVQAGQAVPKIIDFGVAKALSQPLTERTLFTEQGQLIGTPEYMSPEQAEVIAQDIDTRSDVYSLGVVLYELLTGALPFDPKTLRQAAFGEIQRIIREEEPPRPSTRISSLGEIATEIAQKRHTDVRKLIRRLHSELEWIPLMAMRKKPDRRYATAHAIAEDIQNYLDGEPLLAGPESKTYRLKKTIKRYKALVTGVAVVLVVLIAGIVVSTIFAIGEASARAEAEQRQNEAIIARNDAQRQAKISQAVNDFLNKDLLSSASPWADIGRDLTIREVLNKASNTIKGRFENEPLIEASIHITLGSMYQQLGELVAAERHMEHSATLYRQQLGERHPDTLIIMNGLAKVYSARGRYEEAESLLSETLEICIQVLGERHPNTLSTMNNLAHLRQAQGQHDEAESLFVRTLEIRRQVLDDEHPDTVSSMNGLARLYMIQRRYDKAEPLLIESMEICKRTVGKVHPNYALCQNALAELYMAQEQYDMAQPLIESARTIRRMALGENHPDTLASIHDIARLHNLLGQKDKAESLFTYTLSARKQALGEEHPDTLTSMNDLAKLYMILGRNAEAESLFLKVLELRALVLGEGHPDTLISMDNLAQLYTAQGRYNDARFWHTRTLEIRKHILGQDRPDKLKTDSPGKATEIDAWSLEKEITLDLGSRVSMEFVRIPAGSFNMGSPVLEKDRKFDEGPVHRVRISKPFYLGKYEVTQAQYEAVMGKNMSNPKDVPKDVALPVRYVSWEDAMAFCRQSTEKYGWSFRLPTEAEWEFACRAGSETRFYYGDDPNYSQIEQYAWCETNSGGTTHSVGGKMPNPFGLYDMTGNVAEWCSDWYASDNYHKIPGPDPAGPPEGRWRVARGGTFVHNAWDCRSAARNRSAPKAGIRIIGFRTVLNSRQKVNGAQVGQPQQPNKTAVIVRAIRGIHEAYGKINSDETAYADLLDSYETLLHSDPCNASMYNDIAWLLATSPNPRYRDGSRAMDNARRACELTHWENSAYLDTLAATCAEVGNFSEAVKWQEEAIQNLPEGQQPRTNEEYEARLKLYEQHIPYRRQHLWPNQLIAHYTFDKVDGDRIVDSSRHSIDGTLHGDAQIIEDPLRGKVLKLDGDGDWVDCGNDVRFDIQDQITISVWIRIAMFNKNKYYQSIITKGSGNCWRLQRFQNFNSIEFTCTGLDVEGQKAGDGFLFGNVNVNDGRWHHLVGVYDGTRTTLYVDGKQDVSSKASGKIFTTSSKFLIGANENESYPREWNGLIDDVRIYSYALSETEVKELYEDQDL